MRFISILFYLISLCINSFGQISFDSLEYQIAIINSDTNLTGPLISEGSSFAIDSLNKIDSLGAGGFTYHIYYDKKSNLLRKYTYEYSLHYGYNRLKHPNTERVEIEAYILNDSISILSYFIKYYDNEQDFYHDKATIILNNKKDYEQLHMPKHNRERTRYCIAINNSAIIELKEYLDNYKE